jgi:tetratricopeptide (TPR) repeat protein
VLDRQGKSAEALEQFRRAVSENPTSPLVYGVLGDALASRGQLDEALAALRRASSLDPNNPVFHVQLGNVLARKREDQAAAAELRKALELAPREPDPRYMLGVVLDRSGQTDAALKEWEQVLENHPKHVNARLSWMGVRYRTKDYSGAVAVLTEGLKHDPESAPLANSLAWILATCPDDGLRNGQEAVAWAEKASRWNGSPSAGYSDTLAAAYAAVGRFDEAAKTQREAIQLLGESDPDEASSFRERLSLYEAGKPYRQE